MKHTFFLIFLFCQTLIAQDWVPWIDHVKTIRVFFDLLYQSQNPTVSDVQDVFGPTDDYETLAIHQYYKSKGLSEEEIQNIETRIFSFPDKYESLVFKKLREQEFFKLSEDSISFQNIFISLDTSGNQYSVSGEPIVGTNLEVLMKTWKEMKVLTFMMWNLAPVGKYGSYIIDIRLADGTQLLSSLFLEK